MLLLWTLLGTGSLLPLLLRPGWFWPGLRHRSLFRGRRPCLLDRVRLLCRRSGPWLRCWAYLGGWPLLRRRGADLLHRSFRLNRPHGLGLDGWPRLWDLLRHSCRGLVDRPRQRTLLHCSQLNRLPPLDG